jgi:DNA-binding MarR family transcriptional regulator
MDFFDTLVRYETDLWNTLDRRLASADQVSVATMQALRIVHGQPAARVNDLSAALAITVGAASKLVDRLERNGLAVRSPHPTDRRSSVIALTPTGRSALAAAIPVADAVLLECLAEEDVAVLTTAIRRLQQGLERRVSSSVTTA